MRVVVQPAGSVRDAHHFQQFTRACHRARAVHVKVHFQRFRELTADCQNRVERSHGLLEDHREFRPADSQHLVSVHLQDVHAVQEYLALLDHSGWPGNQPHDGERGNALPAAALADDTNDFTFMDGVTHTIYGFHNPVRDVKARHEILDLQDWLSLAR